MTYQIINKSQINDTINTDVQYIDDNNISTLISVAHFRPQSMNDINNNIVSRIQSMIQQQQAITGCTSVLMTIEIPGSIVTL